MASLPSNAQISYMTQAPNTNPEEAPQRLHAGNLLVGRTYTVLNNGSLQEQSGWGIIKKLAAVCAIIGVTAILLSAFIFSGDLTVVSSIGAISTVHALYGIFGGVVLVTSSILTMLSS